jgi:hypothetical protein
MGNHQPCRPGVLTGRIFQPAAKPCLPPRDPFLFADLGPDIGPTGIGPGSGPAAKESLFCGFCAFLRLTLFNFLPAFKIRSAGNNTVKTWPQKLK